VLVELIPIKGIERMDVIMVKNPLQEQDGRGEGIRRNFYIIDMDNVIRREYGQTLAKVRVSGHRTVVILLVYNRGRTCDLEVM